jgi:DNA-binding beta-propeller fold protein YncE
LKLRERLHASILALTLVGPSRTGRDAFSLYGRRGPRRFVRNSDRRVPPASHSVTEFAASNGAWIGTLSGGSYRFSSPFRIVFDGSHLWVTNEGGNSVTEFNASTGAWTQTLSAATYGFDLPWGIGFDGTHVWVANYSNSSLTMITSD